MVPLTSTRAPRARLAQLFALSGAVLAAGISAALTVSTLRAEAVGEQRVEHAMDARRQISDLGANVRGAGNGIRAYLLSKVAADLDHYHESLASLPRQLAALSELTADEPIQRRNIEQLAPLLADRFETLASTLRGAEQTASVLEANQQLMNRIQSVLSDMDSKEQRLLDLRRAAVVSTARMAEIVSIVGLALSLGLVLLGWWSQRLDLRREMQLNEALTLTQTELQRLSADLASSNRDLEAFAGRIAHDLKNALTPMAMAAGLLRSLPSRSGERLGAAVTELGDRLGRVSTHADMMVDSLLAFSRAGAATDSTAETMVAAALREVVDALAPQISSVDVTIQLDLEDAAVRCPPGLFYILAINLVGNAVKFLQGLSPRRVRVLTRQDERWVVLSVEDSGPGIPQDAIGRIFEPFYRVHGTSALGTGIGLATVDRIAKAHGGEVAVRSALGQGTTFEVRFPVVGKASVIPS
jgi:signal transduction histidine kinase